MTTETEEIKSPQWEMYLFVLDEKLKYTPYLVCQGHKRFYLINIWTLTKKEDNKWYASPRITSEITTRSLKQKLKALTETNKYEELRSYSVPIKDSPEIALSDPYLPLDVITNDCVISTGTDGSFIRPSKIELQKIIEEN